MQRHVPAHSQHALRCALHAYACSKQAARTWEAVSWAVMVAGGSAECEGAIRAWCTTPRAAVAQVERVWRADTAVACRRIRLLTRHAGKRKAVGLLIMVGRCIAHSQRAWRAGAAGLRACHRLEGVGGANTAAASCQVTLSAWRAQQRPAVGGAVTIGWRAARRGRAGRAAHAGPRPFSVLVETGRTCLALSRRVALLASRAGHTRAHAPHGALAATLLEAGVAPDAAAAARAGGDAVGARLGAWGAARATGGRRGVGDTAATAGVAAGPTRLLPLLKGPRLLLLVLTPGRQGVACAGRGGGTAAKAVSRGSFPLRRS